MTIKEYTLTDVSDNLDNLHDMAIYLNSGSYTEEIGQKVMYHMFEQIEDIQSMLSFMRYPQDKQQLNNLQKEPTS